MNHPLVWLSVQNIRDIEDAAVAAGVSISGIAWIVKIAASDIIDSLWDIREKRRERAKGRQSTGGHHGPHGRNK